METETLSLISTVPAAKKRRNPRGVFEKVPGSGEWWIRYVDATGRYRREKAGATPPVRIPPPLPVPKKENQGP